MKLEVGYYKPSRQFNLIREHTAVMDGKTLALIAVTGPAHDAESEAYARLFAASHQLLMAARFALSVLKANNPVERSEFLAIEKLTEAIAAVNNKWDITEWIDITGTSLESLILMEKLERLNGENQ